MKDVRVTVNQIGLQVREHPREGDALILLHFSGANMMMWQPAVPFFSARYRLVLVDLRGHGRSDKPRTGYHIDDMARDVIGIMQHLGVVQAHIVGSSLGAEVGLSVAANYPEKVISLACEGAPYSEYGPYSLWEGTEKEFEDHVAEHLKAMRQTPEAAFPSVDALVEASRETLAGQGCWNRHMEAVVRYGAQRIAEGHHAKGFRKQAMEEYVGHLFHCRFEDYYKRVQCPLLMVPAEVGEESDRQRGVLEGLRDLAGQAKIVEVRGWVHPYGWLIDPAEMSEVVLRFLSSVTAHSSPA
jgi:pimeloyl-ACP methyl ester carboxylesterase